MFGHKIFGRVQTFLRVPPVQLLPPCPIIQSLCSNISFHSTRSRQYLQEKRILLELTKMQGKVTKALRVLKVKHILWLTKVHIVVSYDGELLGATPCLYWRLQCLLQKGEMGIFFKIVKFDVPDRGPNPFSTSSIWSPQSCEQAPSPINCADDWVPGKHYSLSWKWKRVSLLDPKIPLLLRS